MRVLGDEGTELPSSFRATMETPKVTASPRGDAILHVFIEQPRAAALSEVGAALEERGWKPEGDPSDDEADALAWRTESGRLVWLVAVARA